MKKLKFTFMIILAIIASLTSFIAVGAANAGQSENLEWIDIVWSDKNEFSEKDLPDGVKGKTYPLPICIAEDNNGNRITDLLYTVKDSDNQTVIVKDGRFNTDKVGVYTVKYSVQYVGLVAEKNIYINAQKSAKRLDVRLKKVRRKEINAWNNAKHKIK